MTEPVPSDYLAERRILRRRVSFWRIAAVVAVVAALVVGGYRLAGSGSPSRLTPHIARLTVDGLITGDRATLKLLRKLEESNAAAVLVVIDSAGGTAPGAERIHDALRRLSAKKPTVAVVGTLAASGGYIAALGTDQIVAQGNALLGSIGVIFQYPNVSKLLDLVGVKIEDVKSSPLKGAPNGLEPTTEAARAALATLVEDSYGWFKSLVKERRGLTDAEVATVADGRVFTGRQSIGLHLADRLGGEPEAIDWLEREKNVPKGLPVRDWKKDESLAHRLGLDAAATRLLEGTGLDRLARLLESGASLAEVHMLDGLVSIWHGGAAD
jgi:protease-4